MKILFVTEGKYYGKLDRKFGAGRTDMNWIIALDAHHAPMNELTKVDQRFDYCIYIVPKNKPKLNVEFFLKLKKIADKVGVMQEANQTNWQNWTLENQIQYIDFLSKCDFIFCHNEIDLKYYSGIFQGKPVDILPTLIIPDNLIKYNITESLNRNGVMLGGTMCQWYGGMDSLILANVFKTKISAPKMGRITIEEENAELINYIEYTGWESWMYNLSKHKFAVHLMRTYAAGSFQRDCAYLGIPCIGWNNGTDTQKLLFPELSPDEGDMIQAHKIAKHLKENKLFYDHVAAYANKVVNDIYNEKTFVNKVQGFLETV